MPMLHSNALQCSSAQEFSLHHINETTQDKIKWLSMEFSEIHEIKIQMDVFTLTELLEIMFCG